MALPPLDSSPHPPGASSRFLNYGDYGISSARVITSPRSSPSSQGSPTESRRPSPTESRRPSPIPSSCLQVSLFWDRLIPPPLPMPNGPTPVGPPLRYSPPPWPPTTSGRAVSAPRRRRSLLSKASAGACIKWRAGSEASNETQALPHRTCSKWCPMFFEGQKTTAQEPSMLPRSRNEPVCPE